jgi:hypothetical protein
MFKGKRVMSVILTFAIVFSLFTATPIVTKAAATNIALNMPVTASSTNGTNIASNAADSSLTTRWESQQGVDPQWITIDLGQSYNVTGVKIVWQNAAGKVYDIQVSKDNATWTTAYSVTNGAAAATLNATFTTAIDGRYVRMYGTKRTGNYGYSIFDFQVYGTPTLNMVQAPVITPVAGTFTSAQTVTITDEDIDAQLYYTTDGSYPTTTSAIIYSTPFTVSNTATVKAVAYKSGMIESNLVISTFTILKPPTGLSISSSISNSASLGWTAVVGAASYNLYRSTSSDGTYDKANTSLITSNGYADIGLAANTTYYYKVSAVNANVETDMSAAVTVTTPAASTPDFGPNVYIFDPSMPASDVQAACTTIFNKQETNQFGSDRYAILFKPGSYNANVRVGFNTQVAGLGQMPDDVSINGGVTADAAWFGGNATCNFWRSLENLEIIPTGGTNKWFVSQAAPLRRVHVKGNLALADAGYSSGGYLDDSKVDGTVSSVSQQQWISRNSTWTTWSGGVWNMVFVGVNNPPTGIWPTKPYTTVDKTPVYREKPFLTIDGTGKYSVYVPSLQSSTNGITWSSGQTPGQSISIDKFYIAHAETDTAATINSALSQGKNLLFTPGIYHLSDTIRVTNANTIVLGLGYATLTPDNGVVAMSVADVDGVVVAGLFFDAGAVNSPLLMEVGPTGSSQDHSLNPTSLSDVFFRVGGASVGKADVCLKINSNNVIGDDFWVWRADHGAGVGWTQNTAANGMIVNGNNVTLYALMVEHFQEYQTLWNGNGGRTYFYQSELPYDVPNQASWMNGNVNGYASYKVADSVTTHEAWGLGIYSYFNVGPSIFDNSAIEDPIKPGVIFHDACTVFLNGNGGISHVINSIGNAVLKGNMRATVTNTAPPIITLLGNPIEDVGIGATYTDAGANAIDSTGVDITNNIVTTITNNINELTTFDSSVPGTYIYHFNVIDAVGNPAAEVTRTVVVADKAALVTAIDNATALIESKTVGTAVGNVSQTAADALQSVIDAATAVNINKASTQPEVDAQVAALTTATTNFNNAIIIALKQVTLAADKTTFGLNETVQLTLSGTLMDGTPADLINAHITYTVDNPEVATVSATTGTTGARAAVITPFKEGKTNVTATVTMNGVTCNSSIEIAVDAAPPTIKINGITDGEVIKLNEKTPVVVTWTASDEISGVYSATGDITSGAVLDVSKIGKYTLTFAAVDKVGNATTKSITYYVQYDYSGLSALINSDGSSTFKLGSTIPVKFQLKDANGLYVTDAAAKLYAAKVTDGVVESENPAVSTATASSGNTFRYNSTSDQYIFNLNTRDLAAGSVQIRIELGDGTSNVVKIKLR